VNLFFPIAHGSIEGLGDLWNGLLHPLRSPAQLLVLVGLGLFAGQRRRFRPFAVPFLCASVAGLSLTQWKLVPEPPVFLLCLVSAFVGLWVALRKPMPLIAGQLLFGAAGFVLGWDSTPETESLVSTVKVLLGVWAGLAVLLVNLASYAQMAPRRGGLKIAFRVLGSWILAISVLYLALNFRR
jgi:hydrogenase/urease accessory protein HupE